MRKIFLELAIKKSEVISFDIFDTLIERTVAKPSDVFLILGKEVFGGEDGKAFCLDRINAEVKARTKKCDGEVTLDEIYEELEAKYSNKKKYLKNKEIEIELKVCYPKEKIVQSFKRAIEMGKDVYLISDMYLPSAVIEQILTNAGINGYNKLYVSNEYGVNKISGKLFETVIKDNDIDRFKMLHIGDSFKADFRGARKAGINAILLKRKNLFQRLKGDNI